MNRIIILLLLLTGSAWAYDPVPADRLPVGGTWEGLVGVEGGIPNRTTVYTNLPTTATAGTINAALNACTSNQVVQLTNGIYTLSAAISIPKSYITLRGKTDANGRPTTIIYWSSIPDETAPMVKLTAGWDQTAGANQFTSVDVSSGATRGSTNIVLASTPSTLNVGNLMIISAPANSATIAGGSWAKFLGTKPFVQFVKVLAIDGTTVGFTPAINADYLASVQSHWNTNKTTYHRSGFEDLCFSNTIDGAYTVQLDGTDECWLKNVKLYFNGSRAAVRQLFLGLSFRSEVRHCEFEFTGDTGSDRYNLLPFDISSALIEDNMFHGSAQVMPIFAMGGSVLAYNLVTDLPNSDAPDHLGQTIFFHGSHNHYNLFEGNWCADYCHDGYCVAPDSGYGCNLANPTHSRNNIWFRERMLGWDAADGGGKVNQVNCWMTKWPTNVNVVIAGCVLGKVGTHTGYTNGTPIFSPDAGTGGTATWSTMFLKANWVPPAVTNQVPVGDSILSNEVLAVSYLHSGKPTWFGNRPWPPFDSAAAPAISTNVINIPAGYRYVYGVDPPSAIPDPPTKFYVIVP